MVTSRDWLIVLLVLAATRTAPAAEEKRGDLTSEIDRIVEAGCRSRGSEPATVCDDATFLRRVWLDLAGRVPPAWTARDFLRDSAADKRVRLVDQLLASEEFGDQWGRVFTELLTDKRAMPEPPYNGRILRSYLQAALAADESYQRIAYELISGEGTNDASGPANFLLRYQVDPAQLTGAVSKKFLGVSLACAQCHQHPFDRWTRDDFWAMAACFARARQMNSSDGQLFAVLEARNGELEIEVPAEPAASTASADGGSGTADGGVAPADGEATEPPAEQPPEAAAPEPMPPQKKQVQPRLLDGTPLAAGRPRRAELAAWVTRAGNPDFSREAVNAIWGQVFSRRLVASRDSQATGGETFETELLDLLAKDFAANDFHVKRLLRAIVLSRTYARPSESRSAADVGPTRDETTRERPFAFHQARPLSVDEVYQSLVQVSGYAGGYEDLEGQPGDPQSDPNSTTDPAVELLGARALTAQRSLALLNSDYVRQASEMGAKLARAAVGRRITPAHVEYVFLAALSRQPTAEESKMMFDLVTSAPSHARGLEDIFWIVFNSAEFNFNH